MSGEKERKKLSTKLTHQFNNIYELKDKDGVPISDTFQRLPLRKLVDYYKIIKNPISLHGIGRNLKNYKYASPQEFVNDLVQMAWNAKLYNVKGSMIYNHAVVLDNFVREMISKLNGDKGVGNLYLPDLGPLPEGEEQAGSGNGGVGKDESYIDELHLTREVSQQPSSASIVGGALQSPVSQQQLLQQQLQYGNQQPFGNRASPYPQQVGTSVVGSLPLVSSNINNSNATSGIRRGRPPIIDKPYETRIKLILKQFKKLRLPNDPNYPLTSKFDRLPDPKYNSPYYAMVKQPISLFEIRTKVRTRKYRNVDEFINDINLMFENSKFYYLNNAGGAVGQQTYQEALLFEQEANKIIRLELLKPEKELLTANTPGGDGIIRIPLDSIEIDGYSYHIGDWVQIKNDNDPQRPTIGQIFRLWATEDGTKYTNVCWYYRPEQTCHRVDRLFFTNEVCKTGQYRDHLALEIVGPCYVIFLTRYQKGDLPEGVIPAGCPWFICEFRYNENSHVFNRIRTWKACLPDEIRDKQEQPLVPLNEPRKLIKFESPIKNMLPQGVDNHMQILDASQGPNPNTPPVVGLVYLRGNADDDELGQYTSSPNVVRLPENDNGREAYLFTPPSQMKLSGSVFPSHGQNNHHSHSNSQIQSQGQSRGGLSAPIQQFNNQTSFQPFNNDSKGLIGLNSGPIPNGANAAFGASSGSSTPGGGFQNSTGQGLGGIAGGKNGYYPKSSYAASMNIYRQNIQQQQLQHQQYQQQRYSNRQDSKRAITPTQQQPKFQLQQQQQQQQQLQQQQLQQQTPTHYSSTATSTYSNPLLGGILSYTTVDENNILGKVTEGINYKRRKVEVKKKFIEEENDDSEDEDSDEEADSDSEEEDEDVDELEDEEILRGIQATAMSSSSNEFVNEIVWYRSPPVVISNKVLSSSEGGIGHSAKYLAWKASLKEAVVPQL